MKTLDRYVVKELLVPLLSGTVVFAMLFVHRTIARAAVTDDDDDDAPDPSEKPS